MNPIIRRELIGALRTRKAVALQVATAAAFALVVLLRWPADAQVGLSGAQSQGIFRLFGYGLVAAVVLLVPAFPATTIVRERIAGTLALLLNSPLSAPAIYWGKLAGALGFVLLPLAMSLPAAAACYAMGGISLRGQMVPLYLVLVLATVEYASLGLLVSGIAGSIEGALRATYGLVLLLAGVALLPYQFLQGGAYRVQADWVRSVSPIAAVMEVLGHADATSQGLASPGGIAWRFALLSLGISAVCAVGTVLLLKQTMLDRPRSRGVVTDELPALRRGLRRLFFLVDPQRRKRAIGRWTSPVMVKEFRSRRFGRSHWMMRLVALCAVVSLGLTYAASIGTLAWGVETIGGIMVMLQAALVVIFTPSLAAGMISAERESGTWTLLRMTPLSAWSIVAGKLASVLWPLTLVLLATVPGYAVMVWIKPVLTQQIAYVLISLALASGLTLAVTAVVSSFCRRAAPAMVTAYVLLVALHGGPLLVWLGRDAPFGRVTVETALRASPLAAAMSLLEVPGFAGYDLLPVNWWLTGGATLACLVVLGAQTWRLTRPD